MILHRLELTSLAALAAMSFAACGSSNDTPTPTGPHYHYVINKLQVPPQGQSDQFGLDLNGDGTVDNNVGKALGAIVGLGFDIQAAIDTGLLGGKLIMLADMQTPDFSSSGGTGVEFFLGDNPQPAACDTGEMVVCTGAKPAVCTGCGHQLTNGSFSIAATSPQTGAIPGKITGGTFNGGPGSATLLISVGDADPIRFDLVDAKIKASAMSEATIGSVSGSTLSGGFIIAGVITEDSVNNTVFPGFAAQMTATLKSECGSTCACPANSGADTIHSIIDVNKDCMISADEVKKAGSTLLQSDLTVDGKPAYSAGIKATAVKATFTVPGE